MTYIYYSTYSITFPMGVSPVAAGQKKTKTFPEYLCHKLSPSCAVNQMALKGSQQEFHKLSLCSRITRRKQYRVNRSTSEQYRSEQYTVECNSLLVSLKW